MKMRTLRSMCGTSLRDIMRNRAIRESSVVKHDTVPRIEKVILVIWKGRIFVVRHKL